ncbi:hypothetical protein UPYG_G00252550 [Umbra pygmaea]|uniref:Uncharacterized protein n=1 Tax=Umbra pygmaea TaxID=75934 RepID=A0ABD0WRP1_UMBPY
MWKILNQPIYRNSLRVTFAQASSMGLIEQIRDLSDEAACEFEQAEITNDNEIQELTREDLNDLLPGRKRLKIRKKIFEIISKSKKDTVKPINIIIEELRGFLTADLMKSALDPGGVLYEYLPILRDLHKQLDKALHFFEAHIELLESYSKGVTNGDHMKQGSSTDSPPGGSNLGQGQHSDTSASVTNELSASSFQDDSKQMQKNGEDNNVGNYILKILRKLPSIELPKDEKRPVKVFTQLCGQTLNAHLTLMKQVDKLGLQPLETSLEDCQVIMVFCPITSRVGTDIEAAMRQVHGDKDAILVVMHHTFDPNYVISQSSSPRYRRVVEEVHVLFHDTLGLQRCETNVKAVSLIYHALKKYTT